jgi:hypothetical protein
MFSVMLQINLVLRSGVIHVWNKLNGFHSSEQIIVRTRHPYFTLLSFIIWQALVCLSKHSAVTRSDNKVRELAIVCLPWQQWTETSVWFDDVDISAFHSCVVVYIWQSVSEWRLLLSECVLVCRQENVKSLN